MTIGEFHNYAVGSNSILVHNLSICDAGQAALKDMLETGAASFDDIARIVKGFENADDVLAKLASFRGVPKSGHWHHTIPNEIQKKLPPHLRNDPDIIGRAGLPNRRLVEAGKHLRDVHDKTGISGKATGIYGGKWNLRFDEEIRKIGYDKITKQQILDIRDQLVKEFGL